MASVRLLFTVTIFVGSALLFLVEPMVAKLILPRFGGAPAVWTAAMLFFQCALLLGYGYAHLSVKWLGPRRQAIAHVLLVAVGLLCLPITLPSGVSVNGSSMPALAVVGALAAMVGVPFLLLSAGAPLIQRWFAHTDDKLAHDPYFLYSASNLGSMVALIAYPLFIEPNLGLAEQARLWKIGYGLLVLLLLGGGIALWRAKDAPPEPDAVVTEAPTWQVRLRWVALAAIPSSLLLSVTTHVTTVIAPVPLLWVIPLALYLLSFIFAFARHPILDSKTLSLAALILALAVVFSLVRDSAALPGMQLLIHLCGFFFLAWACHRTLAEDRPHTDHLTEFFFFIALGGVIGGAFNSIVAPAMFNSMAEYPIALVAAAFLLPRINPPKRNALDFVLGAIIGGIGIILIFLHLKYHWPREFKIMLAVIGAPLVLALCVIGRPVAFASSIALIFIGASLTDLGDGGLMVSRGRSFFGVHQVLVDGTQHMLYHGTTIHGVQDFTPAYQREPITYYARSGPIGQLMAEESKDGRKPATAVVGLGAGTMAAYGQPGQEMDFYDIDPTVIEMAKDPHLFTYLRDSRATIRIHPGDARISLQDAQNGKFDVIVLDAFSSDAIPVHLLTLEAIKLDLAKLAPHGVIAFHISNRYLNLRPVLARASQELGLAALSVDDPFDPKEPLKYATDWVMIARDMKDFGALTSAPAWKAPKLNPGVAAWTDDHSSVLPILRKAVLH